MQRKIQHALVIGGGIGGLCAAIALRQQDVAVDLIEKQAEWNVWGIGIIHQANAVRAEAMLGVATEVIHQGWAFGGAKIFDQAGTLLQDIPSPPRLPGSLPSDVGITRPRLANILLDRATCLNARISLGKTAQVTDNDETGTTLRFSDGEIRRYDLVVGADGIYSPLRDDLWGKEHKAKFAGQGAWRYNMPRIKDLDQVWLFRRAQGASAGMMPLSHDLMYLWATSNETSPVRKDPTGLADEMRALVADIGGSYGEARDRYLTDPARVIYRPFEYVQLPRPWHKGSVVLIGDAAHASTAHLAQGAAQAMEDAIVLAAEVARGGRAVEVLPRWEERRYERSRWVAEHALKICLHEQGRLGAPSFDVIGTMMEARQRTMAPL